MWFSLAELTSFSSRFLRSFGTPRSGGTGKVGIKVTVLLRLPHKTHFTETDRQTDGQTLLHITQHSICGPEDSRLSDFPSFVTDFRFSAMSDQLTFAMENRERILAVENSFGPSGKSLLESGRVLVGEGRLMKLCRRCPQPKVFFLFNDILVYGSIVMAGRWNKNQHIIRLEEVQQEDLEDSVEMSNQWLIKTPQKSFYVGAASAEEKQAWMEHIENCRSQQLQRLGLPANAPAVKDFAATWIPDHASAICMRCSERFSVAHRRHHCRCCGFIVCNSCSKARAVLRHISSKPVRVCMLCKVTMEGQDRLQRQMKNQARNQPGKEWKINIPEYDTSSEEDADESVENSSPTQWFSNQDNSSPYCYFNPDHIKPPRF
ncbi:hypothetical protein SRHO_G00303510 [Serrasalmus rhombeus]